MAERVVVCMKWGTLYSASYVNVLHAGVARHLAPPFRFVCITDRTEGLNAAVEVVNLSPLLSDMPPERVRAGEWQKLLLFKPAALPDAASVLFLDLDVVVCGSLEPFFDRVEQTGGLHICRHDGLPWPGNPRHRFGNSSVLGFVPADQHGIYARFLANGVQPPVKKEQEFICAVADPIAHWPDGWVANFKSDCARPFPWSMLRPPRLPSEARIVMFPGSIKPSDMARRGLYVWGTPARFGIGPVPWVAQYWRGTTDEGNGAYRRSA